MHDFLFHKWQATAWHEEQKHDIMQISRVLHEFATRYEQIHNVNRFSPDVLT